MNTYEYKVLEVRDQFLGRGGTNGQSIEGLLNEHAAQGWRLKDITRVEVQKNRDGVLVTLEREVKA